MGERKLEDRCSESAAAVIMMKTAPALRSGQDKLNLSGKVLRASRVQSKESRWAGGRASPSGLWVGALEAEDSEEMAVEQRAEQV